MDLAHSLRQHRVMAIIRGSDTEACIRAATALVDVGISMVEVSLSRGDALKVLSRVSVERPDALVGAGTVLSRDDVHRVYDAGARYVVTPALAPSIAEAAAHDIPVLAGAFTPSEALRAQDMGAAAIKIFPASAVGPGYFRALHEPFPSMPLVAVGGVQLDHMADYLESGATAVGLGSPLLGDAPEGGDLAALRQRARRALRCAEEVGNE